MSRRSIAVLLSVLLPALASQMRAQSGSADSGARSAAAPLYFRANAHAVIVDVVVTKGRDETVPALQKQDFEIKEDGKPQTIDFFEEHAPAPGSAAPAPALPPDTCRVSRRNCTSGFSRNRT